MQLWTWTTVSWIAGIMMGFGISWLMMRRRDKNICAGTLRVDRSDPDEAPYLFLELEQNGMDKIHRNKAALFNVDLTSYLPRK